MSLKDEQGMIAMGVALMLIVVLPLFGGVLWQYSMAEMQRVERTEKDLEALFLAKSGAEAVMAAWIEAPHNAKPEGTANRLYYNLETGEFQTREPTEYLGYVDVTITKIDDKDSERDQLTEIVATAVVGGVSRQVKVTSYPHLFGHDDSLKWYHESNGIVRSYDAVANELVVIRSKQPIHFQKEEMPPVATGFTAPILLFERPLDLSYNQRTDYRIFPEWVNTQKTLPIRGETIFFDDLVLLDLPEKGGKFSLEYNVILQLPPGLEGIPGSEILGGDTRARYGKVYFDGDTVAVQKFKWQRTWLLWYRYVEDGKPIPLKSATGQVLAQNGFYFRHNTNLKNPQPLELIQIKDEGLRRNELREIKPFVWE